MPHLTLIVLDNTQHGQIGRVVFIAGKKQGNAVWRNRAKRRMRAVASALDFPVKGYDIGMVARRGIDTIPFSRLYDEGTKAIQRAKLLGDGQ